MARPGCPVRGCDRPAWLRDGCGEFPACLCERWLARVLVLLVVLVGAIFGGLPNANADFWSDLLEGDCSATEEYRGFYRVGGCACQTQWTSSGRVWSGGQWRTCAACSDCIPGGYVRTCSHQADWPRAVCVEAPLTADEEEDAERLGDILASLGGGSGSGDGNPFAPGGSGSQAPLNLFGDPVGAVQDDDLVPPAGNDDDGYECPDGTAQVTEGDDVGLCRVNDRCLFYGASGGSWPDCTCTRADTGVWGSLGWYWDTYALRCMPREENPWASVRDIAASSLSGSRLWNLMCQTDRSAGSSRDNQAVRDYLSHASPVFVARRGGVEVERYGTLSNLTINLGAADTFLTTSEEADEETFGSTLCSWLRAPLNSIESAFSGLTLGSANVRCPALTIPFFSQSVTVDVHCYVIGRWLGLIQAVAVVAYGFLVARAVWRYTPPVGVG